jgi:hypothetical protein
MATCPDCGASSRTDSTAFEIRKTLVASPIGSFSLAGAQMKVSAREVLVLQCAHCGWHVIGHLEVDEDGTPRNFVADEAPVSGTVPEVL